MVSRKLALGFDNRFGFEKLSSFRVCGSKHAAIKKQANRVLNGNEMKKYLRKIARRLVGVNNLPFPNDRWRVLREALEYVSTMSRFDAEDVDDTLRGDYLEFGVWEGKTFAHACKTGSRHMPSMRYFACDSFEGLPRPSGIDASCEFQEGQFSCSYETFMENLSSWDVPMEKVAAIKGWFDKSLTADAATKHDISIASVSYIDCDLYESCVPVLDFLTPLVRQGSILMYDDWFCFRADPNRGVQLATTEWLQKNQHISLIPWKPFGPYGMAFFVNFTNNLSE